jgi:phosphoglycolate phosphatase-like HAD superfamily hydrolase
VKAAAVDLDAVLGDTRPLWRDWLDDVDGRLPEQLDLPEDRTAAAVLLDERGGNWRVLLRRFAEDHAPIYLRPRPDANAVLRRLQRGGVRVGAYTDAPRELAEVALAQLGAGRSVDVVGTLDEVRRELGADAVLVDSREQLVGLG